MIRGLDLFGREAVSPNEKLIIKSANKTASDMFKRRFSPGLRENWDKDVKDLTLEDVERDVIEAITKLKDEGRQYAKKIVC
jgi:ribosomal protein S2